VGQTPPGRLKNLPTILTRTRDGVARFGALATLPCSWYHDALLGGGRSCRVAADPLTLSSRRAFWIALATPIGGPAADGRKQRNEEVKSER